MTGRVRRGATLAALACAAAPCNASAAEPVRSVDMDAASAFLEAYRAASEAQSAEFYALYSDRAVIHARIEERAPGVAFQGRAFKAWGRELLSDGRTGLDGSIFRQVTVEQRGSRLLIRAQRYSTTRCYWDPNYQVGIEREGPSYRIVDERLNTNPAATCGPVTAALTAVPNVPPPAPERARLPAPRPVRLVVPPQDLAAPPAFEDELAHQAMQRARELAVGPADGSTPRALATDAESLTRPDALLATPPANAADRRLALPNDLRVTPAE